MDQQIFEQITFEKVGNNCCRPISTSVVQAISTSRYKYMHLVVWSIFGHQDNVPVNITTFNTLSKHITAVIYTASFITMSF